MDILTFERDRPRWWVKQCERVFYQYRVAKREKVNMATVHLDDVADAWFQNWCRVKAKWSWPEFVSNLCT